MAGSAARIVLGGMIFVGATAGIRARDPGAAASCSAPVPPYQIRPSTCDLAQAVAAGIARSATFRELVDRIRELNGIVYVNAGRRRLVGTTRFLAGALEHRVTPAGIYRYLYLTVAPESGDDPLITMSHELQHAIEVLQSNATTEADIDALFRSIGAPSGAWSWETQAALEVERAVRKELAAAGSSEFQAQA